MIGPCWNFQKPKLYNQTDQLWNNGGIWTDNKTFKFIELFKKYDCLYDVQSNDYHNRTRKNAAIKEIAHVLSITAAYKFERDYAHSQPYAHGGPYEQG